jgi:RNA polymerase sigma-70 factor (ECF subfamily)
MLDGLLKSVGLADREAFASLYDATSSRVFGLTRTVLRNDSLAQEVTQDVFLEVWQRAGRFDSSKGSALSWVMTLAHSRAVDKVRHHQAVHLRDHRHAVISYQPDVDVVLQDVLAGQDRQQLHDAMGSITARQHEAISLTFFAGHTYRGASLMLGVPLSTIKTRIRDGLINLRTALAVDDESTLPTGADAAATAG